MFKRVSCAGGGDVADVAGHVAGDVAGHVAGEEEERVLYGGTLDYSRLGYCSCL